MAQPDSGRTGTLEREDRGRVRILAFNRPEAANAFDRALYRSLEAALRQADADDSVTAVVLTGRGRHFSSGTDLVEMAALVEHLGDTNGADEPGGHPFSGLADALAAFRKPLLAAVNGTGIGLGFTMLLHCDIVCMARTARLRAPFTAMGVAPEAGSSYLLPRRMGVQQAAFVLLSSGWVTAEEAVVHGLALKVCDPDSVLDETVDIAAAIAEHPLPSLMATRALLREPEREGIERAMRLEGEAFAELLRRPEAGAGVMSQLDRP